MALTMVELLVAVAILAILASIMMMVGGKGDASAKTELTKSVMVLLDSALQEYHDYSGGFPLPPPSADTPLLRSQFLYTELSSVPASQKILEKIPNEVIQNKPIDPSDTALEFYDGWGTVLDYRYLAGMNFPLIISAGPDKKPQTTDDITNKK